MKVNQSHLQEKKKSISLINIDSMEVINFKKNPDKSKKLNDSLKLRKLDSKNNLKPYSFSESIENFKYQGEGLYFYFFFMKFFGIIFLLIGGISIVSMVFNIKGQGLSLNADINIFLSTTLANTKKIYYTETQIENLKNLTDFERQKYIDDNNKELNTQFYVFIALEGVISLLFFVAIYVFQVQIDKKIKEISKSQISARKYTLMIRGFPRHVSKEKLVEYFTQFGTVKDVAFAYEYKTCLIHIVKLVKYKRKIKKLDMKKHKDKLVKIEKIVNKMKLEMKKILKKLKCEKFDINNLSTLNVKYIFVTFDNGESPENVLAEFKKNYKRTFCQKFTCSKKLINQKYLFENKRLVFEVPDHPNNILWENLEFSNHHRRKKLLFTFLVSLLLLGISFLVMVFLNAYTETLDEIPCDNKSISQVSINVITDLVEKNKLLYCYCSNISFSLFFKNEKTSFDYVNCYDYVLNQIKNVIISFVVGIVITVFNMLIELIIFKMVLFIKYNSITEIVKKQIIFTLMVEYINTSFVIYFIYSDINGFSIIQLINKIIKKDLFSVDTLVIDVDRQWYKKIGSKLITPLLIAALTPHFIELIKTSFIALWKLIRVKWAKTKGEYIKIMKFKDFDLGYRFKNLLSLILICFTFSAGIPIFNILICLGIFFTFWIQKLILIKFSNKTPPYSNEIIKGTFKIYKVALILHICFAIYFLSNEDIFPTKMDLSLDTSSITFISTGESAKIFNRLWKVFPLVLVLLFILSCYICELFFFDLIRVFVRYLNKNKIFRFYNENFDTYENNLIHIKSHGLKNYQIKENPEYRAILNFSMNDIQHLRTLVKNNSFMEMLKMATIEQDQENGRENIFESKIKNDSGEESKLVLNQPQPEKFLSIENNVLIVENSPEYQNKENRDNEGQ